MALPTITPTDKTLGAIVTDVDLKRLDDEQWREIERAFHVYAVLIFPGQHLSPDAQVTFAERFGEIELLTPNRHLKAVPISNVRHDGTVIDPAGEGAQILKGNEGWHTDSSYMPLSARASCLSAHVVPKRGGQTEWADMRAAWDALEDETKARIEGLAAYHSLYHSQAKIGHEVKLKSISGFHEHGAPLRPLVKLHPVTGRKALYVGRHAYGIPGLSDEESERLLDELVEFACQPPRTYAHDWHPGDVAIWDNRCVLHRARPFDWNEPRRMVHVRVAGDPRTERAKTSAAHR